jgi:arylsulfatase A-like enzyme
MKAIVLMFDSLNRRMLSPYGCDWTRTPNFARLARRTATFDNSYVCSMPCMPARRELHTARPNFLHRAWGPLEPWDDSVPAMLQAAGVRTHLASDHYHYWEDGGATYHTRYGSWEFFRGQEGDPWMGQVADPEMPRNSLGRHQSMEYHSRQDMVNRGFMRREADHPQARTFAAGLDFIRRNADQDQWMLQIETFDPHEPFFSNRRYKDLYPYDHDAMHFDWPFYRFVDETPEQVQHIRYEYAALLSQCDAYLGDLLDMMDEKNLWDDTMLIVFTDHGFMLGEHNCWAKVWQPFYQEIAHTPFFVWDPRCRAAGERRSALVQPALDTGPTLLRYFGLEPTGDMLGCDLAQTAAADTSVRDAAIFGMHGAQVNVTDGRYVYMRAPATSDGGPLYNYTHMPTAMRGFIALEQLRQAEMSPAFTFTKGCPTMRIPARFWITPTADCMRNALYDLEADPGQQAPVTEPAAEARMVDHMQRLMLECDAPGEQFLRLGLA